MANPTDEPIEGGANSALTKELLRVNRALRTLSAGNHTLLRASGEQELLRDMCQVIVETGGYRMACVAYAEHDDAKSIRWMVCIGTEMEFLESHHFTWAETEVGRTATGTAIRTGEPVVGRNLLTDPAYAIPAYPRLRKQMIQSGYASATAFPLRVEGEVLGALVMGAVEPDAFNAEEVKLLQEMADDLAYGIANLRMRVQHRAAQATIARLAYYDALTGMPNRTLLLEQLEEAMQAAKQQHRSLALLHLEVGRFHEINKVLGYRAGDELLQELGRRLAGAVQDDEMLARVGEAEFALLLPNGGAEHAIQVAQRLVSLLREPVMVSGLMLDANPRIGIALFPGHATDADALIRRANAAMHQTKPVRGGYAMYTGGQEQEHIRRLALMGDLHRAIEHNELRLYCQPKVAIASRRVCGAEALVRWQHPQHGMISTTEFIQLAEQAGTITPLTNWMLEAAFSQSYAWQEAGLARALAVNLSAHDLYDPGLIDRIRGLFSTWGLDPALIQFELTESALMADPAAALETLTRLKQLEVELFVDDYGTGYSSLSYLQMLPVDGVKIDQSFVMPMMQSSDSEVIVHSTIELGHNLGLKVVAEGVESQAIWERLAGLGCDVAQGYLISKPMPAEQFQAWESNWSQLSG
ncbi:putative bifunctional diguanylate cyclase/phosphodiesterase [Rhodoferax ferrireducens]|uniref:putative bifunctional diguanylate cyclase/phosphodiesterase n=1 Tax=Rhodoferax ferrireducens TaxID=192843 RepID=UPI000E0D6945|nr:GGDEF domain-containing protein [Rhodoferax ferrireducens]